MMAVEPAAHTGPRITLNRTLRSVDRTLHSERDADGRLQQWWQDPPDDEPLAASGSAEWPSPPDPLVYHGLAGELVEAVEDYTEADPVALLGTVLAVFGTLADGPTFYQGSQQRCAEYVVLAGDTSVGRKGTAYSVVRSIFLAAVPEWEGVLVPGLGSGEGLIGHLQRKATDPRALVYEPELSRILRVMGREGSTLSPVLRDGWDGVTMGRTLARESSLVHRHHVGMLAHVTPRELRERLDTTDAASGWGNRFLWLAMRKSRDVPRPGDPVPYVAGLLHLLAAAVDFGREPREVCFTPEAAGHWDAMYPLPHAPYGLLGDLTARGEAHVARLALVYATLDRSPAIDSQHLARAVCLWEYAVRSARYIFGESTGDSWADLILEALRNEESHELARPELRAEFHDSERLSRAIGRLVELGLAHRVHRHRASSKGGRRAEWVILDG